MLLKGLAGVSLVKCGYFALLSPVVLNLLLADGAGCRCGLGLGLPVPRKACELQHRMLNYGFAGHMLLVSPSEVHSCVQSYTFHVYPEYPMILPIFLTGLGSHMRYSSHNIACHSHSNGWMLLKKCQCRMWI